MPIANIFSSYWSYIQRISESYRNDFLNLNEMRTEHTRENAVLSLQYNKKHELLLLLSKGSLKVKLNPNQAHVCCVSRHMAKLCSYSLYKNFSKKCYKREAPLQEGRTKFDNGVLSGT